MKKIGVITLWSNNYGSVLQCYALKKTLEGYGYKIEILYQDSNGVERYKNYVRIVLNLVKNGLIYPSYIKSFFEMRQSRKNSINGLTNKSSDELNFFVKTQIQPKAIPYSEFKKLGKDDQYVAFVAGSDQIWNGSVPFNPISFLEFAPNNKKIAYAPSFGTQEIACYNQKKFARAIEKFSFLSIREDEGKQLIKQLVGMDVLRMPDPTVLLSKDEWKSFANTVKSNPKKYVMLHFLSKPNSIAMNRIENYIENYDCEVICFGYEHDCFKLKGIKTESGSPQCYLNRIRNASAIFTDSFHTSLFAVRFSRQFYVFDRQYDHKYSQGSRIFTLLRNCNLESRYIINNEELNQSAVCCDSFFNKERKLGNDFLEKSLPKIETKNEKRPLLKDEKECCGCGNCAIVCPQNAIKMIYASKGFTVPEIDREKCINCGKCEQMCNQVVNRDICQEKKAYIAYNKNKIERKESASGGVFSALASQTLNRGGVVFGAALDLKGKDAKVRHCMVETQEELHKILKSKYVQSDCYDSFEQVNENLQKEKTVLFGGTSCQINALYQFLGKRKTDNLYTVDFVCHGVPGGKLFADYIKYLENINGKKIIDFDFRKKMDYGIEYILVASFEDGEKKEIEWKDSSYYKMFLRGESYRDVCYECKFASIQKSADITIGDYFEAKQDYPEMFDKNGLLDCINGISCIIVQNDKGHMFIQEYGENIQLFEADLCKIQNSHNQLCFPSRHTKVRNKFFTMYKKGGFRKVERYYKRRKSLFWLPMKVNQLMKISLK
ncbi:MAG: polysaccharide pyruvyl transferase family protein [Lachnospiraceae bacterium]